MRLGGRNGKVFWMAQVGLGFLLILLLGVHLIVNHLAAPQGLLIYADIVRYYQAPGIAGMEGVFLVVVTAHCLLGVYSILLDLNPPPVLKRAAAWLLTVAGLAVVGYGLWLIGVVAGQPLPRVRATGFLDLPRTLLFDQILPVGRDQRILNHTLLPSPVGVLGGKPLTAARVQCAQVGPGGQGFGRGSWSLQYADLNIVAETARAEGCPCRRRPRCANPTRP